MSDDGEVKCEDGGRFNLKPLFDAQCPYKKKLNKVCSPPV